MGDLKILVVDDHSLVREGLSQVLQVLADRVVVLQSGTCSHAFEIANSHTDLDLVLLDYHLPDMTGLDALPVFRKQHPELPIVILSGSANVQILQHAAKAGAAGYIQKSAKSEELLLAINRVLAGELFVAPTDGTEADSNADAQRLTPKQQQVLNGLLDGLSNREISEAMFTSEQTTKTHVAAILRHFGVQNRTQAVTQALTQGYRSPLKVR
jgi:DNA-binding NarL/FixJ family response regulator